MQKSGVYVGHIIKQLTSFSGTYVHQKKTLPAVSNLVTLLMWFVACLHECA